MIRLRLRIIKPMPQTALFLICLIAYTCAYISRDTFSAVMPNILTVTSVTKTEIGLVSTTFLIFYGAGQLVSGYLGDRIKPHYLIACGLFVSAIVNFSFGFTNTVTEMCVLWGCNGMALCLLWPPIIKIMSVYMDDEYRKRAIINVSVSMPIGTLSAYVISALLVKYFNFRYAFYLNGVIIMSVCIIWIIISNRVVKVLTPQEISMPTDATNPKSSKLPKMLLASGMILIIVAIMANGIIRNGVSIWVPTYLTENFNLEQFISILTSTVIPVINVGGIYAASFVNDKTKNEMLTAAIFFGISVTNLLLLIFFGNISPFLAIIFLGITTSSMQGLNAIVMSFVPIKFKNIGKVSTVTGILNSSSYMASSMGTYTVGIISTAYGWNVTIMFWMLVAAVGVASCLFNALRWKKFADNN